MIRKIKPGKLTVYLSLIIAIISASSCIKDYRDGETNFSGTQPVALIAEGGLSSNAFGAAALTYPGTDLADTATFHVNYAADNVASTDEQFTLGIDQNALKNYNTSGGGLQYEIMPDSDYSFTATAVTVAKGKNYAAVPVIFHPSRIDPTRNYLLPISITAAPSGTIISDNQATIYYHAIGNPLAGNYLQSFYRWNDVADTTGPPNSTVFENQAVTIVPVDPTTIILPESYLETFTGSGISLSFTNTNGVLSDFSVDLSDAKAVTDGGFTVNTAPKLVSYKLVGDASTHYAGSTFRTYMEVTNSSGGNRKVVDNFVKQ